MTANRIVIVKKGGGCGTIILALILTFLLIVFLGPCASCASCVALL